MKEGDDLDPTNDIQQQQVEQQVKVDLLHNLTRQSSSQPMKHSIGSPTGPQTHPTRASIFFVLFIGFVIGLIGCEIVNLMLLMKYYVIMK